jgi:hypothetical protein
VALLPVEQWEEPQPIGRIADKGKIGRRIAVKPGDDNDSPDSEKRYARA